VSQEARRIPIGADGVAIRANGAADDYSVLVEITAHVGRIKGGQIHKLAADAFKLIWAGSRLGSTRLILAVIDEGTEAYLRRPKAWLTGALEDNGVEVIRVEVPDAVRESIAAAQRRQVR